MDWKPASRLRSPLSALSPLASPTLSSLPSKLRNRVPTQIRRAIPIYLVCVVLFILSFKAQVLPVPLPQSALQKRQDPQKPLAGSGPSTQLDGFPKKIWQSWKTDPLNFDKRDSDTARTWTSQNPGYRYEVLTDHNDLVYVEEKFGPAGFNRPDIVELYRTVNATIIKADLLRYMIMYAEGGVYADIDVEALKPVDRFIPARYRLSDIDMVIGVEIDQPHFRDHPILGPKSMSFCQWTFMCRPRLPVMLRLIEDIMAWLADLSAQQNVPVSDLALDFDQIISGTGPSAFTAAVLAEMNNPRHHRLPSSSSKNEKEPKKEITFHPTFHALDESLLVSRILVLDVEKFAAGQGHSDSGNHGARGALVKHHYHASNWPARHPRYSHPAYGEVERCNWDVACVGKWDEDVAAYGLLTAEEQERVLEVRKGEVRAEVERAEALERFLEGVKKQEEEEAGGKGGRGQGLGFGLPPNLGPQGLEPSPQGQLPPPEAVPPGGLPQQDGPVLGPFPPSQV